MNRFFKIVIYKLKEMKIQADCFRICQDFPVDIFKKGKTIF